MPILNSGERRVYSINGISKAEYKKKNENGSYLIPYIKIQLKSELKM
jgi:hypothetical protein